MDWIIQRQKVSAALKKYRYAIIVVMIGLILMWVPGRKKDPSKQIRTDREVPDLAFDTQQALEAILSQISGTGAVKVLLTESRGEEKIYQTDINTNSGSESLSDRKDTVIITGTDRQQDGLIRQINPAIYQGAIVVCQGADNASVRLAVVNAVESVTGLDTNHICVLKMK